MLNTEHKNQRTEVTTDADVLVGTITYQPAKSAPYWVELADGFHHSSNYMGWKNLKAAEYHILAMYLDNLEA